MKTVLFLFALMLSVVFSANASTVTGKVMTKTENTVVANSNTSSRTGKSKKAHHKKHKNAKSAKKAK